MDPGLCNVIAEGVSISRAPSFFLSVSRREVISAKVLGLLAYSEKAPVVIIWLHVTNI